MSKLPTNMKRFSDAKQLYWPYHLSYQQNLTSSDYNNDLFNLTTLQSNLPAILASAQTYSSSKKCPKAANTIIRQLIHIITTTSSNNPSDLPLSDNETTFDTKQSTSSSSSGNNSSFDNTSRAQTIINNDTASSVKTNASVNNTVILTHIDEVDCASAIGRAKTDHETVLQILDTCDVDTFPITISRIGQKSGSRPRPIQVTLPTSHHTRHFISNAHRLRSHTTLSHVKVRKTMTATQLQTRHALIIECQARRNSTGEDFIVYRGAIIRREDINSHQSNENVSDNNLSDLIQLFKHTTDLIAQNSASISRYLKQSQAH